MIFLERYRPIPEDLVSVLPLYPVNPFSKILGRSSALIPAPVSSITSVWGRDSER